MKRPSELRVLHVAWDGHSGGTQRYIDGVLRSPDWRETENHTVALFTSEGDQINSDAPYPVEPLGISSGFSLLQARRLGRIVDDFDPSVVHVHCDTPAFLLQAARFAKQGRRLIYTEHGDCFARERRRLVQGWCWNRSAPHWHRILANSEFARETLCSEVPSFEEKSEVLPNPILDDVPDRPDRAPGVFRIGGLGRLEPIKGFDLLLEAAALLKDEHEFEITIYGKGDEETALHEQAARLGIDERLQLPGYTRDPMLALAGFDLVVIPSRKEAFGLVAIEAQAVGTPVVVTEVGGLSERVDPGTTGWRVPPEDPAQLAEAIRKMIADESGRKAMADAARTEVLRDYDLTNHVAALRRFYQSQTLV